MGLLLQCKPVIFSYTVENYAPFQSMSVRDSFLTVSEGVAEAPGPGYYSPLINLSNTKGGSSLNNKVINSTRLLILV